MTFSNLIKLFAALRRLDFNIGLNELLDAVSLLRTFQSESSFQDFKKPLSLMWCKTVEDQGEFELEYSRLFLGPVAREDGSAQPKTIPTDFDVIEYGNLDGNPEDRRPPMGRDVRGSVVKPTQIFQTLPLTLRGRENSGAQLHAYTPLNKRSMFHLWRYFRSWELHGPRNVLDIESTVKNAAEKGAFVEIKYKRRKLNNAKVILMVDRNGSMMPFHRYVDDMAAISQTESTFPETKVYYFHNIFSEFLYSDPRLCEHVLFDFSREIEASTSVLFLSDAGAARGRVTFSRIVQTYDVLRKIGENTRSIAWLNPMPSERWRGTSAGIIARAVPMFQMDEDGLSNAIDTMRGVI